MSDLPLVLVPPSKSMQPGGRGRVRPGSGGFGRLGAARQELVAALASALAEDPEGATRWFHASGDLLHRAREAFEQLARWEAPGLPAVERFTGVVWDHLDPRSLDTNAQTALVVPNAVLGLSAGTDPVPDHRLAFGVNVPGLGRLDRWWRPHLTASLALVAGDRTVVDMLPQEHAAAIDLESVRQGCTVVRVRFLAPGGRGAAGHAAKAVKGVAARAALTDGIDALARLRWDGWRARRRDGGIDIVAPRT